MRTARPSVAPSMRPDARWVGASFTATIMIRLDATACDMPSATVVVSVTGAVSSVAGV